jgi:hypothetical protein
MTTDLPRNPSDARRPPVHPAIGWALFVALVFAVYFPAIWGPKLWDDSWLVDENPFFRSPVFIGEVFRHYLFLDSGSRYFRPVQNWSYIFDYALWGDSTVAYHATNIVIHATAAFLLWRVLRRLLGRRESAGTIALGVSAIWAVHPIHSAAVAYISGRADPLIALFVLAAWLLLLKTGGSGWRFYLLFPALLFLGLGSQEIAADWILLLLLFAMADRSFSARTKMAVAGLVALSFGSYLWVRAGAVATVSAPPAEAEPLPWRVCLMLRALGDYASLIVCPSKLFMDRVLMVTSGPTSVLPWLDVRGHYLSLLGAALLPLMAWSAVRNDVGRACRRAGLAWFWIAFLPISNLFPLNAQSAEHWIYAASIGFLLFLAGILRALPQGVRRGMIPAVALAVVALGVRTWVRAGDWADPERFYRSMIASGGGTVRAHTNLAELLRRGGRTEEAEKLVRDAIAQFPTFSSGWGILAKILNDTGRSEEAGRLLAGVHARQAGMDPAQSRSWQVRLERVNAQAGVGDVTALNTLEDLIRDYPEAWQPTRAKAMLLEIGGDVNGAIRTTSAYVGRNRWHFGAAMHLAGLLEKAGLRAEAEAMAREAAWLDIRSPEPERLIGRVRGVQGKSVWDGEGEPPGQAIHPLGGRLARSRPETE